MSIALPVAVVVGVAFAQMSPRMGPAAGGMGAGMMGPATMGNQAG